MAMSDSDGVLKQRIQWQEEQERLRKLLVLHDDFTPRTDQDRLNSGAFPRFIGGIDVSFSKKDSELACGVLVVINTETMDVVYEDFKIVHLTLPYIPGFLAFRESPVLLELIQKLMEQHPELAPDLVMVDGNGILHPRGFGLASHIGVLANIPTIGVAKNLYHVDGLCRQHLNTIHKPMEGFEDEDEDDDAATHHDPGVSEEIFEESNREAEAMRHEDVMPLIGDSGRVLGMALRRHKCCTKPIFISIGHRISLATAVHIVRKCCKYRIPEPVRQADIRSRERIRATFDA